MAERKIIVDTPKPQRRDDRTPPPPVEKREDRIRDYVQESYDQLPVPEVPDNPKKDD
jgi:hypothetical protein